MLDGKADSTRFFSRMCRFVSCNPGHTGVELCFSKEH